MKQIIDKSENHYNIIPLTKEMCLNNSEELLQIINIIPYINWNLDDLLEDTDYYNNKWQYSYVIVNSQKNIIGVLIAYFRLAKNPHILDSLYIHKLAISPENQNKTIGTQLLKYFIEKSFSEIPWLLNISVQTNLEEKNKSVIDFYRKSGFKELYKIEYKNKIDNLFLLERCDYKNSITKEYIHLPLQHPRLNYFDILFQGERMIPTLFFSTSSETKRNLYTFIFNNYNIDLKFVKPKIALTEPQLESSDSIEERNLVLFPLKLLSRFIDKTPLIIEDTMLFIEYFNNKHDWELPGPDTKRWWRQIGDKGIAKMLGKSDKRNAKFVSQIGAYLRKNDYSFGRGEISGRISETPRINEDLINKRGVYPYFFHSVFIPDGSNKTLAEMDVFEYAQFDYRRKCALDLISQLRYSETLNKQITLF